MYLDRLQTAEQAFRQIVQGEAEWIALGNFQNYWYSYAVDRRRELVADPLPDVPGSDLGVLQGLLPGTAI